MTSLATENIEVAAMRIASELFLDLQPQAVRTPDGIGIIAAPAPW